MEPDAIFEEHRRRIVGLIPEAFVSLSGSASVSGLDANDVDLVALVADVTDAATRLRTIYAPLYEDEWRVDWVAFRDPGPPQVDVVVTRRGTKGDAHHRRAWQLLASDDDLLAEYRNIKEHDDRLEERKAAFFERVVALLPPGDAFR